MKEFAVKEIHKGTETSKLDLDTLSEQLSNLQHKVRNLYSLDDALKGETGKAIRSFYNEIHTPFLTFLLQSMEDYKNRLENMKNDVQSFESNHQGYISEGFLDDELQPGLDKAKSKVASVSENINSVLSGVADIKFVAQISYSDFETYIEKGKRQIDEVITDLGELDSKHASKLQETQSDLKTMKKYLSEMTTGVSSGAISISEFDTVSLQDMNAYNNIIQQNYGNGNIEITEDNIEYLPMAAIAAATEKAEKGMDEGSLTILQHAYKSLQQGGISRKEYNAILSTATKKNGSDDEKTDTFLEYLSKNLDKISQDVSKDVLHNSIQQLGLEAKRIGNFIQEQALNRGIQGPPGPSSFIIPETEGMNRSQLWNKYGGKLISGGKVLGKFFAYGSAAWGWREDVTQKGKTHGEAFIHNGASLVVGAAAGSFGSTVTAGALTFLGVSNPAGWAVLGGIAAGVAISTGFNWLYDENIGGIQDKMDYVGNKIEDGINYTGEKLGEIGGNIKESISDAANKTGEAIESGLNAINPMNWGWN
ncbi:LXG domain-containing protein [Terribacillus saccharophilus]|uniref:LXG domain-containing protein n=1 Tax=Terribacillus saccharophilus TaxID=361277 RepID=A0ABX4GUQ9_9BACI|nr:LXG domain-containing protein [Terribacillus saccharophilus]PAD34278.1 hypothetical protein CHH56_15360 [Terribacillus saccharophilus]PAD94856.1 hypothetical protein CHH50_16450 [Terribacillus saccharophilus]PAD98605.1 hypothetical protein CHH48_16460 [Terribacillus saccharophilus]